MTRLYGTDITAVNKQPIANNSFFLSLFYIGFVLIGSFLLVNLFVGLICNLFNDELRNQVGYKYLSND